ncbi:MAG TPA: hypothetical protein VJ966_18710 [Actinomycetes bacterium]|nr:hypothetical protein [Actinomycetes bacterium]
MGPVQVVELTVALEYAMFSLRGELPPDAAPDALDRVVDEAVAGQGIASTAGNEYVVVLSPHQSNFAMPLRAEVWPGEPPDDLDQWQEAFCTGLAVGADGVVFESPTAETRTIPVPPGRYAVRITGRGFVRRGWPGTTTPGDEWRLQLWLAPGPISPRRLRAWMDPATMRSMEGSGWAGDLDQLRAPDVIPWLGDSTGEPPHDG